ncbi:DUF3106 domain-containing protein [Propionivibrio limicola]|uniref:DUF3106 domain-containing protein n=1 Tax=Propionivibrio limicola TaxID=167645 RepID=UPI001291F624|nr:DUF3106 domain-containing protein [Propionivibrio limicola]
MARAVLAGIILCGLLSGHGWAATAAPSVSPSLIVTPPQPAWSDLTIQQKIVLSPLCDDWDSMEYHRQKKWLTIAARFTSLSPVEQLRIQRQMQAWGKMTPRQRQIARENFKTASQLPSEKKKALKEKWEEYLNLPEEEKNRYKQEAIERAAKQKTSRPNKLISPPSPLGDKGTGTSRKAPESPPPNAIPESSTQPLLE